MCGGILALTRGMGEQRTRSRKPDPTNQSADRFQYHVYTYFQTKHQLTMTAPPYFPVHDTESDSRWGWLGLACETTNVRTVCCL